MTVDTTQASLQTGTFIAKVKSDLQALDSTDADLTSEVRVKTTENIDQQTAGNLAEKSATKPGLGRLHQTRKTRPKANNWNWTAISRKLFNPLCAAAISSCFGCTSVMDQGLKEPIAIRHCYVAIRDNKIKTTDECSEYAQRHLKLYSEIDQSSPERAACGFSEYALAQARRMHPYDLFRIRKLDHQKKEDCLRHQ